MDSFVASHQPVAPPSDQGRPPASLLVVEDDPQISAMYKIILENAGYRVSLAGDGIEALERYGAARQDGRPYDLVMMDLNLPRMDGLECLRHLAEIDQGIRVLVSTGSPLVELQDLPAWVAGVVRKPVRMAILLEQVSRALPPPRPPLPA